MNRVRSSGTFPRKKARGPSFRSLRVEPLETRRLLSLTITEFQASNDHTLERRARAIARLDRAVQHGRFAAAIGRLVSDGRSGRFDEVGNSRNGPAAGCATGCFSLPGKTATSAMIYIRTFLLLRTANTWHWLSRAARLSPKSSISHLSTRTSPTDWRKTVHCAISRHRLPARRTAPGWPRRACFPCFRNPPAHSSRR